MIKIHRARAQRGLAAPRAALAALVCLLAVGALGAAGAEGAGGRAAAARTCKPPAYPGLGYFTSLSVTAANCATADKLVFAYYRCRLRSGPAGRCTSAVIGFTCHERRNSIPTEIDARVRCHRRTATVVHTYQQDVST